MVAVAAVAVAAVVALAAATTASLAVVEVVEATAVVAATLVVATLVVVGTVEVLLATAAAEAVEATAVVVALAVAGGKSINCLPATQLLLGLMHILCLLSFVFMTPDPLMCAMSIDCRLSRSSPPHDFPFLSCLPFASS